MNHTLLLIKIVHTLIWAFFAGIILYILVAAVLNQNGPFVWIAIVLVLVECGVLLLFGWECPLTRLGRRYATDTEVGFDIFLPKWLARHNKGIFSTIFIAALLLLAIRMLST